MGEQITMFNYDCHKHYKITKPSRLIELFAGIGAQAEALENLGIQFEHYKVCEFDKYAVQSYNAIHGTNFKTSDITKIHAADLGIVETDKYEYIMTYSFPCQDLSIAGKQSGMAKGSGTRSGLLWEVERLLRECKELPQVLLMENVPQVLNCDFGGWLDFLDSLGYKNYYKALNAKNFGIPQNRERCFMVSVLGNYYYEFPKAIPLELRLKDILEEKVDEKYYLSEKAVGGLKRAEKRKHGPTYLERDTISAKCVTTEVENLGHFEQYVKEPQCNVVATLDIPGRLESACRVHGIDGIAPAYNTCGGGGLETKIAEPMILQQPHGFNKGAELEHCPLITTSCWESNNYLKEPIIVDDIYNNREPKGDTTSNTITTVQKDNLLLEPTIWGNLQKHSAKNTEGICPTLTEAMGMGGGQVPLHNYDYRIRKLTPKECWRLMGFKDSDFDKAKASGVSDSQLYKQAGNSIVVPVLEHIFEMILKEDKQ